MIVYLAAPYSHPSSDVRLQRYETVSRYAAGLLRRGITVFSPITHGHVLATIGEPLPTDWEFWRQHDEAYLSMADELYVLRLDGWAASKGVFDEIAWAEQHQMPVTYV